MLDPAAPVEKVQLISRDDPKMKPNPLATLQERTPALTPCACAPGAKTPAAKPSAAVVIASFLIILELPNLADRDA